MGVLVQSNYGGILTIAGAPVGRELGRYSFQGVVGDDRDASDPQRREGEPGGIDRDLGDGSIMMVVATDAPLSDRKPRARLGATGAPLGLGRTGVVRLERIRGTT